jgi:hypothetical protein
MIDGAADLATRAKNAPRDVKGTLGYEASAYDE